MTETARILVIDDEESIRRTISLTLKHAGYMVDTAENGREAIERSMSNFYNLALIDIRLPDMEGTTLLSSLRETTPRMVKIILTGFPSMQNAVKAINRGVDAYLIKPVDTEELVRLIKECLEKQRKEKEYGQEKIAQFLETRLSELQTEEIKT